MKILLCEDVPKLGWLGDVVEVTDGYARNYLLPQRIGIVPTEGNLRSLAEEKSQRAAQRVVDTKRLEKIASEVEGAEAVVAAKANEAGHLFGSIGPKQIAQNLREQGFGITDEIVQLQEHIKEVGTSEVKLRFSENLVSTVNVVVVAEQDAESESTEEQN